MSFISIYLTSPNDKVAKKISEHLLKKRLVACTNRFPVKSGYWWKGKIVQDNEVVMFMKTRKELFNKVKKEIEKLHPYTVPCIIRYNVTSNSGYEHWLRKETKR